MGVRKQRRREERRAARSIWARGVRRGAPDFRKLARALLAIAQAEAEAQGQSEAQRAAQAADPEVQDAT